MKKLVHILLISLALLGSVSVAFADGGDPMPTGQIGQIGNAR